MADDSSDDDFMDMIALPKPKATRDTKKEAESKRAKAALRNKLLKEGEEIAKLNREAKELEESAPAGNNGENVDENEESCVASFKVDKEDIKELLSMKFDADQEKETAKLHALMDDESDNITERPGHVCMLRPAAAAAASAPGLRFSPSPLEGKAAPYAGLFDMLTRVSPGQDSEELREFLMLEDSAILAWLDEANLPPPADLLRWLLQICAMHATTGSKGPAGLALNMLRLLARQAETSGRLVQASVSRPALTFDFVTQVLTSFGAAWLCTDGEQQPKQPSSGGKKRKRHGGPSGDQDEATPTREDLVGKETEDSLFAHLYLFLDGVRLCLEEGERVGRECSAPRQQQWHGLSVDELRKLCVCICRIQLDSKVLRVRAGHSSLRTTLAAAIQAFPADAWDEQLPLLVDQMLSCADEQQAWGKEKVEGLARVQVTGLLPDGHMVGRLHAVKLGLCFGFLSRWVFRDCSFKGKAAVELGFTDLEQVLLGASGKDPSAPAEGGHASPPPRRPRPCPLPRETRAEKQLEHAAAACVGELLGVMLPDLSHAQVESVRRRMELWRGELKSTHNTEVLMTKEALMCTLASFANDGKKKASPRQASIRQFGGQG